MPTIVFVKSGFELIRKYGSSDILVAKRIQKSLYYIKSMTDPSEKKSLDRYINNCYVQAQAELQHGFDKESLSEYKDQLISLS